MTTPDERDLACARDAYDQIWPDHEFLADGNIELALTLSARLSREREAARGEGMVLVPREPTEAMVDACVGLEEGWRCRSRYDYWPEVYRAMIAAYAPQPVAPVDPLLIEAREMAAKWAEAESSPLTANAIRHGVEDDHPRVTLALAALTRGAELQKEGKVK